LRLLRDPRMARQIDHRRASCADRQYEQCRHRVSAACQLILVHTCWPWALEHTDVSGSQSKNKGSRGRRAHLPHFVQVGQPGGMRSNGVNERAIVGHRVGAAAEGLSVKAAVEQPLAPLGCCLPRPHSCIKQQYLQRKANVSRSSCCLS
jgi:hypothetical protein